MSSVGGVDDIRSVRLAGVRLGVGYFQISEVVAEWIDFVGT